MEDNGQRSRSSGAPPTVRQVYALAGALCAQADESFPETREQVSELIERLRREAGHPAPRLEDSPLRSRRGRRRGGRGADRLASKIAARVADELR
jgi:hypothetical protein